MTTYTEISDAELLQKAQLIYPPIAIADALGWAIDALKARNRSPKLIPEVEILTITERRALEKMLPAKPISNEQRFTFIDLFAGIGGIRKGFESTGGKCVFTSEYDKYAVRTYLANHYCDHPVHGDIREITQPTGLDRTAARRHINQQIPDHDILLAGFPCQPFSIAGVSKKNALGRAHGFECETQGTLFFDIARIIEAKRPIAILLENVKNLKSHDKGKTFSVILSTLNELGYDVADCSVAPRDGKDPKIINAKHFVPQNRERILLAGFRKDLGIGTKMTLKDISQYFPAKEPKVQDILEPALSVDPKYTLSPKLWKYLQDYAAKHKKAGNGFGCSVVNGADRSTRTLSARYYKDGSEVLIDQGDDKPPRRLTPQECARLMGFDRPGESLFRIPVSDTQAYKQFGNSVVVPVFEAAAKLMTPHILQAKYAIEISNKKDAMVA